ncbi:hypothetical protein [Cohnella sp. GCM10027633]|uniref:hypothetical protein n=1 Tax=unclassified Cohnella TaxID=2636738 RepID=UPI00362D53A1
MRKDTFKLLMLAGVVAFAVLYGMELSSRGIENVNGKYEPIGQSQEDPDKADEWVLPTRQPDSRQKPQATERPSEASELEELNDYDAELYGIPRDDRKPLVDRVSGATADVLHGLSKGGIKFVVSIFDKATGS